MPRKARLDEPGALHHIIVRGIERRKIFRDDGNPNGTLRRPSAKLHEIHALDCSKQTATLAA
jgi:hypothetical protein